MHEVVQVYIVCFIYLIFAKTPLIWRTLTGRDVTIAFKLTHRIKFVTVLFKCWFSGLSTYIMYLKSSVLSWHLLRNARVVAS